MEVAVLHWHSLEEPEENDDQFATGGYNGEYWVSSVLLRVPKSIR
jgi:hypothetical protein